MERPSPLLGKPLNRNEHYTVVGAGIAGLFLGFFLKEAGVSFEIWEKESFPGGILRTKTGQFGRAEMGANGVLWCSELDYLCEKLDIKPLQANLIDKKRFLVRNGKLSQFPLGPIETLNMLGRLLVPHQGDYRTVSEFGRAYLGKAANAQILSPALSGIYGTSAELLSFRGAAKMIAKILDHSRWLPLGIIRNRNASKASTSKRKGLHSFPGGMESLVKALASHLSDHIVYNKTLDQIDSGRPTILTVPAHIAYRLIPNDEISKMIQRIGYQGVVCANLIFKKSQFSKFKKGFGCLIPRDEGIKSLGVLFTSVIYPERVNDPNHLSLRCIMHLDESNQHMNDNEIEALMCRDLDKLFDLSGKPLETLVTRWPQGLPIYSPEHYELLPLIDDALANQLPNLRLFGNYTGEISVRGACQSAYEVMESLSTNS